MTKEKLEQLKEILEITRKLISIDIYFCIYDTDCIVRYMYPEDGDKDGIYVGSKFEDPTGKLDEVIQTEKYIHNFIPMDRFGFYMEGNLIPVYDNGELCGVISSAYVPMNQQQLAARELAVQSIYYLIMSVDMKNNYHCTRLYFDYETQQFPTDAQHFDDFCEKSISFIHPEDRDKFIDFTDVTQVWERLQNEKMLSMECRLLSVSGEYRWAELILTRTEEFETSDANTAVYMVRDIHKRKSVELDILRKNQDLIAQLEKNNDLLFEQGMTDELTKMYNRKGLVWFGKRMLEKAKKKEQYIYTMVADLNGLKYINDQFGHEEGDKAIRTIAGMLKEAVPSSAIVSRTGGDEFTIMAKVEHGSRLPQNLEKKLLKSMNDFNESSGLSYMVEASYGWDFRPALDIVSLDDCVKRADNKMYAMKTERKTFNHFSDRVQNEMDRRFGSAKQKVFVLSECDEVQENIANLLDSSYLLIPVKNVKEAATQLAACDEMAMLFVDNQLEGQSGLVFVKDLPEIQRKNLIPILLLESENDEVIAQAFEVGIDDVLMKPFDTVLNRCRIKLLSQRSVTNQKLSQMLEQQADM